MDWLHVHRLQHVHQRRLQQQFIVHQWQSACLHMQLRRRVDRQCVRDLQLVHQRSGLQGSSTKTKESITSQRTFTRTCSVSKSKSIASMRQGIPFPTPTLSDTLSLVVSITSTLLTSLTSTASLSMASRSPSNTLTPSLTNTQSTASLASHSLSRPSRTRSNPSATLTKSRSYYTNNNHKKNNNGLTLSISLTITAWNTSSSDSHSITRSFSLTLSRDSPTVSSSATCTPDIYISTRTPAETLGNEAHYCNTAWNLQNNNHNDDSSATSRTGGPPSCFVGYAAVSQIKLLQNLVFSRVLQCTIQLPVYLVLPFALNATDWVVENTRVLLLLLRLMKMQTVQRVSMPLPLCYRRQHQATTAQPYPPMMTTAQQSRTTPLCLWTLTRESAMQVARAAQLQASLSLNSTTFLNTTVCTTSQLATIVGGVMRPLSSQVSGRPSLSSSAWHKKSSLA